MVAVRGRPLFKKYIKNLYGDDVTEEKISIDFNDFNVFVIDRTGKDFWELELYKYLDNISTETTTYKLINVPENISLHELSAEHNNKWISAKAMIKNITDVRVDLKTASYRCLGCNSVYRVPVADPIQSVTIPVCTNNSCGNYGEAKGMVLDKDTCEYRDYKLVKLEQPLELRNGGATREFKAILLDSLANPCLTLKPGDVCDVTGTFKVEPRKKNGRADGYEFIIHVHNITPVEDVFEDTRITEDDVKDIKELSEKDNVFELLVNTLAPEVYGYDLIKQGILLSLFEGNRPDEDTFKAAQMDRWTIHILLIGDPGIGKSQLIQSVKRCAPKNITIAGTNTSQAGLTTSAVKDELTGTWAIEAGAIVLADTGNLCIDEFDKLTPSAQKSLNEPMEQLVIGSAKAGLVQTMTARTSVIAAANPKYGKFRKDKDIAEQLDIADSTLSRFDLLFVLEDNIIEDDDRELAKALLNKEFVVDESETLDLDLFKKYITYAKANCFPELTDDARVLLQEFYVNTRQEAKRSDDGKPITPRDLKALERLTIASAKSELRCEADEKDVERVLAIYLYSLDSVGLTPETAGALQRVRSDKENEVFDKVRELLDEEIGFEGLPLSSETEERLRMECEIECTNTRLNGDDVYDEVLAEIQKGL
jgi:replicative DNA helicase Mcm